MNEPKVFRISKPGHSASSKLVNPKNLVFDNTKEQFQFRRTPEGTGLITFGYTGFYEIDHGLNAPAAFMAYIKKVGSKGWERIYQNVGVHEARISSRSLKIFAHVGDKVRYFIFPKPLTGTGIVKPGSSNDYSALVSREGADVKNMRENEVALNSDWGTLMIYDEADLFLTVPATGGVVEAVADHGLEYPPAFTGLLHDGFNYYPDPIVFTDFVDVAFYQIQVTETQIIARAEAAGIFVPAGIRFKIHLFTEPLE